MFKYFQTNHHYLTDALHTENHFLPIFLCSLISLFLLFYGGQFTGASQFSSTSHQSKPNPSTTDPESTVEKIPKGPKENFIIYQLSSLGYRIGYANIIVYILIAIIFGTFVLVFLVKNGYFSVIKYWFSIAYFIILFAFNFLLINHILKSSQLFVFDLPTVFLILWNICEFTFISSLPAHFRSIFISLYYLCFIYIISSDFISSPLSPAILGVTCVLFAGPIFLSKLTLVFVTIIFSCVLFIIFGLTICWILILAITVWDLVAGKLIFYFKT